MQSATLSRKTNRPLGAKISSEGNYTKIDIASGPSCLRRRIERGQELTSAHFLTENLSQLGKRHSSVPVPDALQGTARSELCILSAPVVNRLCLRLCERKTFVRYGTTNASFFGRARALFACCWREDPDNLASPDQRKSPIPGIGLSGPVPILGENFNASLGSGTMYRPLGARLKLPGRDPEAQETLIGFESRFVAEM